MTNKKLLEKMQEDGLLGNRNKKMKLAICKKLTNTANLEQQEINTLEILKKTLGVDFNLCPFCKNRTYDKSQLRIKTNN